MPFNFDREIPMIHSFIRKYGGFTKGVLLCYLVALRYVHGNGFEIDLATINQRYRYSESKSRRFIRWCLQQGILSHEGFVYYLHYDKLPPIPSELRRD